MSNETVTLTPATETTPVATKRVPKAKAAKPAAKGAKTTAKATAAKAKPAAKRASTGNLSREDAEAKVLKVLKKGRATRTELKAVAPYGNYTALTNGMEEAGLVKATKLEDDTHTHYELTAKGRKAAG